jgi:hypothetical protein
MARKRASTVENVIDVIGLVRRQPRTVDDLASITPTQRAAPAAA